MSDVKKFTGFIAVDGSTHTSQKAAIEHSRQVKIQTALKEKFGALVVGSHTIIDVGVTEQNPVAWLADFLYENRDSIIEALNQEVLTRKKRAPNKAKVKAEPVTEQQPAAEAVEA